MTIFYEMRAAGGELVCTGSSQHCFVDSAGRPARLRRSLPEFDALLCSLAAEGQSA